MKVWGRKMWMSRFLLWATEGHPFRDLRQIVGHTQNCLIQERWSQEIHPIRPVLFCPKVTPGDVNSQHFLVTPCVGLACSCGQIKPRVIEIQVGKVRNGQYVWELCTKPQVTSCRWAVGNEWCVHWWKWCKTWVGESRCRREWAGLMNVWTIEREWDPRATEGLALARTTDSSSIASLVNSDRANFTWVVDFFLLGLSGDPKQ